jgi:signal transduction histidine kinase
LGIEVRDDGLGGAHAGFGLTSIHDRVTALGGTLALHSPAGAGTRVEVTI